MRGTLLPDRGSSRGRRRCARLRALSQDFDALFKALGLDELPADVTAEATFVPNRGARTIRSEPRAQPIQLTNELSGTLPRLQLASPEAAKLSAEEAELEPLMVLGEGGMGRVLLARQSSLSRDVAVKILRGDSASEASAEALIHEARTTGGLEHPSVVPIYALARDGGGLPALVMKRVEGVVWRDLMQTPNHPAWNRLAPSGRDRLAFHVEVLVQVCNAVAHAHQRGVIHRDVKPANVLLGDLGEVYLADWGVALKRADAAREPTRLVGTPAYLAPEMVTGDARMMDERTDVYLLGGTLHELLIGAPPHVGTHLREVLQRAWESPPPVLPASAPPLLVAICKKALSADPAQRYPTATALRDELKRFLQFRGASELADAATKRLAELESMTWLSDNPAEQRRWYTLVSECRFGFKQALEGSPEHVEAREGLRRCLEVAARHELERGAAASARAFLSELEQPPALLMSTLAKLEAQEEERARAQAEMKRLSHELDLEVSQRQRTFMMFALAGGIALMVTALGLARQREDVEAEYGTWFRMAPLAVTALVYLTAMLVGRKSLFSNRINRQLMALVGTGLFGALIHRAFSVVLGISAHGALAQDAVLFSVLCTFGAFTVHRGLVASAICFMTGALGCTLFPRAAVALFGATAAISIAMASAMLWVSRKKEKA